jgi:FkbM family methyltransferase
MTGLLKETVKRVFDTFNYRVSYAPRDQILGFSFNEDIRVLVKNPSPVCFDVGANQGQTIQLFQELFDDCRIYAFEPSSESFQKLQASQFGPEVSLYKSALGQRNGREQFFNYEDSCLSSCLTLDANQGKRFKDTSLRSSEVVEIQTIDWFVREHNIRKIDLLKIDTQGYDLEVLKGAAESFERGVIENVLVELNFVKLYKNQGDAYEITDFLARRNIRLVDYYDKVRGNHVLDWCNALYTKTAGNWAPA